MKELWVEKYRPQKVDEYVFVDQSQKDTVLNWLKNESIPHLLLSGDPGTGKTTYLLDLVDKEWDCVAVAVGFV